MFDKHISPKDQEKLYAQKQKEQLQKEGIFTGKERRITLANFGKMSEQNIELLKSSYRHPFEKVPEEFYKVKY